MSLIDDLLRWIAARPDRLDREPATRLDEDARSYLVRMTVGYRSDPPPILVERRLVGWQDYGITAGWEPTDAGRRVRNAVRDRSQASI